MIVRSWKESMLKKSLRSTAFLDAIYCGGRKMVVKEKKEEVGQLTERCN